MEDIIDIIKITVPPTIVFLTAWIILRNMIRNDQDRRRQELVLQGKRTITPIKLQAYERIVLFLERISMESLLVRISSPELSAAQLHSALLTAIRSEFEHNLSQQIYMSPQAWEVVRNAKSGMIKMINIEADAMPQSATALDLGRQLLEKVMQLDKEPTRVAIEYLKDEIGKLI